MVNSYLLLFKKIIQLCPTNYDRVWKEISLSLLCNEDNVIKVHKQSYRKFRKKYRKIKAPYGFRLSQKFFTGNKTLINGFIQINTYFNRWNVSETSILPVSKFQTMQKVKMMGYTGQRLVTRVFILQTIQKQ